MTELKKIHEAILKGDLQTSVDVTKEALEEGTDPQSIIREYMIPAMDEIGTKFEQNEAFVPELLMAARAIKGSLELLRPLLAETGAKPEGKVIIGGPAVTQEFCEEIGADGTSDNANGAVGLVRELVLT